MTVEGLAKDLSGQAAFERAVEAEVKAMEARHTARKAMDALRCHPKHGGDEMLGNAVHFIACGQYVSDILLAYDD